MHRYSWIKLCICNSKFNFQAGYLIPQGFITLLHRCKNWFISQGNLVISGMHYVLPVTSIYLVSYSEPTLCFANAQAFPSRIALHYPLKMNYVLNPLIHLRYFQSCLIEYYDLLCVHVLICIWFGSPALADWPWSSLEEEKKNNHKLTTIHKPTYLCILKLKLFIVWRRKKVSMF